MRSVVMWLMSRGMIDSLVYNAATHDLEAFIRFSFSHLTHTQYELYVPVSNESACFYYFPLVVHLLSVPSRSLNSFSIHKTSSR